MKPNKFFQCPVCMLHYIDAKIAKECEKFCRQFHGCSLEITMQSLEHQEYMKKQRQA